MKRLLTVFEAEHNGVELLVSAHDDPRTVHVEMGIGESLSTPLIVEVDLADAAFLRDWLNMALTIADENEASRPLTEDGRTDG